MWSSFQSLPPIVVEKKVYLVSVLNYLVSEFG